MKIDVKKIEGYENMTDEEKLKALEDYEFNDEPNDVSKLKSALDKATSETAKYKKELRELQSEEQRKEAERKEAEEKREAQLQELIKEKTITEHKANFLKVGYTEELALQSANAIVDGDFKTVFANLGSFIEERDKKLKAEILDSTKRPKGSSGAAPITKEQFKGMSFTEKNKLYMDNPDLYHSLKEGD